MDSSEMSKMYIDEYISRARKAQAEFEKNEPGGSRPRGKGDRKDSI